MKTMLMGVSLFLLGFAVAAQPPTKEQDQAVAAIIKMGGSVRHDDKRPGRPVIGVDLNLCELDGQSLKYLPALTEIETLDL